MPNKKGKQTLLKVPFVVNPSHQDCGPTSLLMALKFFKTKANLDTLIAETQRDQDNFAWTIGLAKTAAEYGLIVDFYSRSISCNPDLFSIPYYQRSPEKQKQTEERINRLIKECKELKVNLVERTVSLQYILSRVNDKSIPIALLDWSIILGSTMYQGHYVPIVGYSEKEIIIHDSGPDTPRKNLKIRKNIFETARKARGTDEDILFLRDGNKGSGLHF